MKTHYLHKKAAEPPKFLAHVCGQTAEWIKMALGMELGLGPVHIVLDGDTAPLPQKAYATLCSMWTQLPPEKMAHPLPPNCWSMFIVAKWLDG